MSPQSPPVGAPAQSRSARHRSPATRKRREPMHHGQLGRLNHFSSSARRDAACDRRGNAKQYSGQTLRGGSSGAFVPSSGQDLTEAPPAFHSRGTLRMTRRGETQTVSKWKPPGSEVPGLWCRHMWRTMWTNPLCSKERAPWLSPTARRAALPFRARPPSGSTAPAPQSPAEHRDRPPPRSAFRRRSTHGRYGWLGSGPRPGGDPSRLSQDVVSPSADLALLLDRQSS
jgi:hypothetical protein